MSETKFTAGFTAGPWEVEFHTNGVVFITSEDAGSGDIADLYHRRPDGEIVTKRNARANAYLISASPELYVIANHPVLEWILTDGLSFIPEPQRSSVTAFLIPLRDAALAKARGETS